MKVIAALVLPACAAALLAACGGTKNTAAEVPATSGEFDSSTGSWKPLSKIVAPPPHQQGAVIVEQKKPGVMDKVGKTLKKPLEWVGLAKDEPAASSTTPTEPVKKTAPPQ
jgi:hypothetical protein